MKLTLIMKFSYAFPKFVITYHYSTKGYVKPFSTSRPIGWEYGNMLYPEYYFPYEFEV